MNFIVWMIRCIAVIALCIQFAYASTPIEPRILNGKIAQQTQFPWQVALTTNSGGVYIGHFCSGSLISERWVLTAAHCLDEIKEDYYIFAGSNTLDETLGQLIPVKRNIIHQQYNNNSYRNDIALLELERPVDMALCGYNCQITETISPHIESQNIRDSTSLFASGWGVTEDCNNSDSIYCLDQEFTDE